MASHLLFIISIWPPSSIRYGSLVDIFVRFLTQNTRVPLLDRRIDLRAKVGHCTRPLRLRREDHQEWHLCRPGATYGYVNTVSIIPLVKIIRFLMCHAFRSLAITMGS